MMPNRAEVLALALAARTVGAVVVPLGSRSTAPELSRMVDLARPAVVVVDETTGARFDEFGLVTLDVDHLPRAGRGTRPAPPAYEEGASGRLGAGQSMLFTSGTTGAPKAALRARGDAALASTIADAFGFSASSRFITSGPLYHSGPWTCSLMALSRGGMVVIPSARFEPGAWFDAARRHRVTTSFITPTQLRALVSMVEAGELPPTALETVVVSGEPFPAELKERLVASFGPHFGDCYGCTELGPLTWMPAADLLERPQSCGRPFPGVDVAAFAGDERLPPGEIGVVKARTPLVFEGYLTAGSDRAVREHREWATVNDLGFVDADGYLHLAGRSDDMVITGGVNVFPADVEAVLIRHPAIQRCAVFGVPDEQWGQVVVAAVVGDRSLTVEAVRTWMRGRISDDKRPRRLLVVASLPTTDTGKVSRRVIRDAVVQAGQAGDAALAAVM